VGPWDCGAVGLWGRGTVGPWDCGAVGLSFNMGDRFPGRGMQVDFAYGRGEIALEVPAEATVYASAYPAADLPPAELVLEAVRAPLEALPLAEVVKARRPGDVVVVVSDITRPIPYRAFLPELLDEIEGVGVGSEQILILVATGMHRPSTAAERAEMFGGLADRYRIADHDAADAAGLIELPGRTWGGARVEVNRRYMEAGCRIVTGLVEPHFMAGFSGGRKAICPGLASLATIERFHGAEILANPAARNAHLADNPCHNESLSVARMAPPDFSLNVVLNRNRDLVAAFAGGLEAAHRQACAFVRRHACPAVAAPADVVVTSCGGYPLDATFYQCVKGFVSCLPAVREGGVIVAFGSCSEGIGSTEYERIMDRYAGSWRDFLADIREPGVFTRDQWQFQMHARALERVGQANLHFVTDGIAEDVLSLLSVNGHAVSRAGVRAEVQGLLDACDTDRAAIALLPEGPYCTPVGK
ncbi:MAG: nickel-dependent lactate racemase, partial [Kiritimatiellae bacterium]|nr:nickel-dependent lactate racemase [Kiritimatiellia bacterium]